MKNLFLSIFFALVACFLLFSVSSPCRAERNSLTVSLGSQKLHTINPAYSTSRNILILYHNWGDTLLYRDPKRREIVPCLAETIRIIDPQTIEFTLRKGVRFHNGEPFDARAVKFSLDLLKSPDSKVSRYLAGFTEALIMDAHTVRIKTTIPNPTTLEIIANTLFIFPPDYYGKVGKEGFEKHPVGTGPYMFCSQKTPMELCFKANPDYFGGPKGKAAIPHLITVVIPEEIPQIQALITGRIDLTRSTNALHKQIPFLKETTDLSVKSTQSLRANFICMDAMGRSGTGFFKDRRIRKAVNHAINKEHIVQEQYSNFAHIAWSATSPLHFGHESHVRKYPYDPIESKRLLAEAGYPQGFTVDFYCAGVSESACESIAEDLETVGINTNITWMGGEWSTFYKKFLRGELPLAFLTWGSYSIFDASAILNPFFMSNAPGCYGTTPEIDKALKEANNTMHQEKRKILFSEAQKEIAEEAFWVPICTTRPLSIMKKKLNFEPNYDEIDRYFTATWEKTQDDSLKIAMKTRINTLAPSRSTTRETFIMCHHWADTLLYRDSETKTLMPCLAESYRLLGKDGIEFTLRKGIRFHNGEPFNAQAVKASFDCLRDIDLLPSRPYSHLKEITVLDDYTLRIQSESTNRIALEAIANVLFIYPPEYLKEVGWEGLGKHPVGTGPYRFVSWKKPGEILFERNPDYFGGPKGKPIISNLKIYIIQEELLRIEALINGNVDMIRGGSISPEQAPFLSKFSHLKLESTETMRMFFLVMDAFGRSGVEYFKDRRVRRAVNYAIDKKVLVKKILGGYATATHTLTTPFHFAYEKDVTQYPYDPEKAKRLLAEAGYPDGFTVDFYFTRDESIAEAIAAYLNDVGIKTRLHFKDKWRELYEQMIAGNTPLVFVASGGYSIPDASAILDLYFPLNSPRCFGSTKEIDTLLTAAGSSHDDMIRKKALSQAQKLIAEEAFWVPLYYGNSVTVSKKTLNFKPDYDEIDRYFAVSQEEQ